MKRASWYDVMYDDDFRRIAILKRSLNFFFLAFCGVIYQNLLHRRVYIAVSSSKLLFRHFCEKLLHITFKPVRSTFTIFIICLVLLGCPRTHEGTSWAEVLVGCYVLLPALLSAPGEILRRTEVWGITIFTSHCSMAEDAKFYSHQHSANTVDQACVDFHRATL